MANGGFGVGIVHGIKRQRFGVKVHCAVLEQAVFAVRPARATPRVPPTNADALSMPSTPPARAECFGRWRPEPAHASPRSTRGSAPTPPPIRPRLAGKARAVRATRKWVETRPPQWLCYGGWRVGGRPSGGQRPESLRAIHGESAAWTGVGAVFQN